MNAPAKISQDLSCPWKEIPSDKINGMTLTELKTFWKTPVARQKSFDKCCNCGRDMKIFSSGLCNTCYITNKDRIGVDLLNSLTAKRASLLGIDTPVEVEVPLAQAEFTPAKITGKIPVTDKKYVNVSNQVSKTTFESSMHDALRDQMTDVLADVNEEYPGCDVQFVGFQPGEDSLYGFYLFVVGDGPLDGQQITVKEAKSDLIIEQLQKKYDALLVVEEAVIEEAVIEEAPEESQCKITPVIKQSIVIEFGDAELEFRAGKDTIDIKIEESGDLIFFARDIDKSFIKKLCELI